MDLLAAAAPVHPPGAGVAEHALTYGHLLDEVLRRATGEPLHERFARVAAAAGWDLHLRVADHDLARGQGGIFCGAHVARKELIVDDRQ